MPMKSKAQSAAMHAAAAGKSTLGIPKSVGREFVAAQAGKPVPKRQHVAGKAKGSPFRLPAKAAERKVRRQERQEGIA